MSSEPGRDSVRDALDQQAKHESRLFIRPDERVKHMGSKKDTLTDQVEKIALILTKTSSEFGEEEKERSKLQEK